jgi:hypothetical protein
MGLEVEVSLEVCGPDSFFAQGVKTTYSELEEFFIKENLDLCFVIGLTPLRWINLDKLGRRCDSPPIFFIEDPRQL